MTTLKRHRRTALEVFAKDLDFGRGLDDQTPLGRPLAGVSLDVRATEA
jgi:hypothetical protein